MLDTSTLNLNLCEDYARLCDEIDRLQGAGKWDEASPLCDLRRPFDAEHMDCPEAQ